MVVKTLGRKLWTAADCHPKFIQPPKTETAHHDATVDPPMVFAIRTTRAFASDMRDLSGMLAHMGGLAQSQVAHVIEALATGDREIAREVVAEDAAIDAMQRTIGERVIGTIARRQPVAVGLREVLGIWAIASELERIGDLAKDIGKRIQAINGMTLGSTLGLRHMALAVLGQLRDVLDSLVQRDVKMAVDVWARDEDVDRLCAQLSRELVGRMAQDPDAVMLGIQLLFCTKNLERVGDHATNIAEAIYYVVEGRRLLGERPKADVTSIVTK
jgi:phosphate transport system protein